MAWSELIAEVLKIASPALRGVHSNALKFGQVVAIRTFDGQYFSATPDGDMSATVRHVQEWECFELVDAADPLIYSKDKVVRYGDQVALRATVNDQYIGARLDDAKAPLTARVPWVKAWETFTIIRPPNYSRARWRSPLRYGTFFTLQAYNSKYVMYNREGDGSLQAITSRIGDWEIFAFIDPSRPK